MQQIWTEVRAIAKGQIDSAAIAKIQAIQRETSEKARPTDRFWLGQLSARLRYGLPLAGLQDTAYAEKVATLAAADLQAAAQRFVLEGVPLIFRYLPAEPVE